MSFADPKQAKLTFTNMLKDHCFFSASYCFTAREYDIWSPINNKSHRFTDAMKNEDVYKYYESLVESFRDNNGINFHQIFRDAIRQVYIISHSLLETKG